MQIKYYVLMIWGDIEPSLSGPFVSDDTRDDLAAQLKSEHGDEHGIYALDVDEKGEPVVDSYPAGFFMDNDRERCTRCSEEKYDVRERHSYGVYAGKLCTQCCYTYRDHCGIDQPQGRPEELEAMGETYWEEE